MKKIVLCALILFVLTLPLIQAKSISEKCNGINPYEYDRLMECEIASYASSGSTFYQSQINSSTEAILATTQGNRVDVSKSNYYFSFFRYIFVGLLVLLTALTGYQFMTSSSDPVKREEAKKTFKYILVAGAFVSLLPLMLAFGFNLSNAITSVALDISTVNEKTFSKIPTFGDPDKEGADQEVARFSQYYSQIPSFISATRAYTISMNARHLLLLLLISISPLILLSYIYAPLRSYGKLLLYLFGIELLYPTIAILILHFSLALSGNQIDFSLLTSALLLSVIFHAILLIATILKATVQVVTSVRIAKDSQ